VPGSRLVIPITPKNPSLLAAAMEGSKTRSVSLHYKVRKGDTLALVADRFGVEKDDVLSWNKLKTSALVPGRVLTIRAVQSGPAVVASAHKKAGHALTASAAHHVPTSSARKVASKSPGARISPAKAPAKLIAKSSTSGSTPRSTSGSASGANQGSAGVFEH
jgi:LysM repeat protein